MPARTSSSRWQLGLLVSLFVLWGACNALNDVLIRQFKKAFTLTDTESSLVQTAFYSGYLFGSLPAAAVARRCGYKACVCCGLALVVLGALLFWPCTHSASPAYAALLACLQSAPVDWTLGGAAAAGAQALPPPLQQPQVRARQLHSNSRARGV